MDELQVRPQGEGRGWPESQGAGERSLASIPRWFSRGGGTGTMISFSLSGFLDSM
ncbi:MAG: hypothetical protein JXM72_07480 [Deltaproteobacteria bacterium]|nr:hypothetical protein [Deltaproteobacteria bacterium]